MREIVLDTETTGLDPSSGHRVVEIGCVELINHLPSGSHFHKYLNPQRDMPEEAFRIHGLSNDFLAKQPLFKDVAAEFLAFIGDAMLVIHNAEFDLKFLNAELVRLSLPTIPRDRAIDTVPIARRRFPGAQANLDALCRRFEIDNSSRTKHGALLDSELLAEVYLELIGGRQPGLELATVVGEGPGRIEVAVERPLRAARPHAATDEELAAHAAFVAKIKNNLWAKDEPR